MNSLSEITNNIGCDVPCEPRCYVPCKPICYVPCEQKYNIPFEQNCDVPRANIRKSIEVEPSTPMSTGLIGEEFTITTHLSTLVWNRDEKIPDEKPVCDE